ncbi:MAG TPA: aldo/keto reductase [Gemmatimonadales bacterium]
MKFRQLVANGPPFSAVGFGGMHLSIQGRPSEAQGVEVIHAALDAGSTLIDTADAYCLDDRDVGHNERLIARGLRGWSGDRSHVLVATKGGVVRTGSRWLNDGSPGHLHTACDASLRALGVDRIDLYQLHAPDPDVPFEESVGALGELQRAGKVRWVGLSNVTEAQIRAAERIVPVTTVQNRLNPFFREALADGVLRYCTERGIGFLAYSPTGGGRLNLKLPSHPALQPMAARLKASAHQLVLAWVLAQSPAVVVIPSARTVEHARDSSRAADLTLSPDDLAAIDRAEFSRA